MNYYMHAYVEFNMMIIWLQLYDEYLRDYNVDVVVVSCCCCCC